MNGANEDGQKAQEVQKYDSFDKMGLPMELLRGIYGFGFEKPSMIQQMAIVPMTEGRDILAQARSGTGKTGTFSIGSLSRVDAKLMEPQVLVMAHTRELATQIASVYEAIGSCMGIKVLVACGGIPRHENVNALRKGVHVVVGTPGRIYDLAVDHKLRFNNLRVFVLDEVDVMLDGKFAEQVETIVKLGLPATTNVALFSATLTDEVTEIADMLLKDPTRIVMPPEEVTLDGIKQYYVPLDREEFKLDTLCDIYDGLSVNQALIYVNSRDRAEMLYEGMVKNNFTVSMIHGDMDPPTRAQKMSEFRSGDTRVLISTDLLSRGIDVQQVSNVINFEVPPWSSKETYIHRIGRSGRFGRKGVAISLVTPAEYRILKQMSEHFKFTISELPADLSNLV